MEISTQDRRPARLVRLLVNLMCAAMMLLAVAFIVPAAFGLQRYVITGTSMTGAHDLGSVVFEEVVPVNDLAVGDVITYMPPAESGIDHLVTHRIVSIEDGTFRTKGDAVDQVDPWTFRLDGVSQPRVKYSVPYVGFVFIALQDRTTRVALIGVPAGIVAMISLFQLLGAVRRRPGQGEAAALASDEKAPVSVSKPTVTVSG